MARLRKQKLSKQNKDNVANEIWILGVVDGVFHFLL